MDQVGTTSPDTGSFTTSLTNTTAIDTSDGTGDIGLSLSERWPLLLLLLLVLLAIVVNAVLMAGVCGNDKLRTLFYRVLVSFATTNVMYCVIWVPFALARTTLKTFPLGRLWCEVWASLEGLFTAAITLHFCLLAYICQIMLTQPLKYKLWQNMTRLPLLLFLVWILAFICIIPSAIFLTQHKQSINDFYECGSLNSDFILARVIACYFTGALCFIGICYRVLIGIRRNRYMSRFLKVAENCQQYGNLNGLYRNGVVPRPNSFGGRGKSVTNYQRTYHSCSSVTSENKNKPENNGIERNPGNPQPSTSHAADLVDPTIVNVIQSTGPEAPGVEEFFSDGDSENGEGLEDAKDTRAKMVKDVLEDIPSDSHGEFYYISQSKIEGIDELHDTKRQLPIEAYQNGQAQQRKSCTNSTSEYAQSDSFKCEGGSTLDKRTPAEDNQDSAVGSSLDNSVSNASQFQESTSTAYRQVENAALIPTANSDFPSQNHGFVNPGFENDTNSLKDDQSEQNSINTENGTPTANRDMRPVLNRQSSVTSENNVEPSQKSHDDAHEAEKTSEADGEKIAPDGRQSNSNETSQESSKDNSQGSSFDTGNSSSADEDTCGIKRQRPSILKKKQKDIGLQRTPSNKSVTFASNVKEKKSKLVRRGTKYPMNKEKQAPSTGPSKSSSDIDNKDKSLDIKDYLREATQTKYKQTDRIVYRMRNNNHVAVFIIALFVVYVAVTLPYNVYSITIGFSQHNDNSEVSDGKKDTLDILLWIAIASAFVLPVLCIILFRDIREGIPERFKCISCKRN